MPKVRIMTYNVHSCIGCDNEHSPERIAKVINYYEPDIVTLQELDTRTRKTGGINQPELIGNFVQMDYHFHPAITAEEGLFGNAILSRFPITTIKAALLPQITTGVQMTILEKIIKADHQPRGAIWVSIDVRGTRLQVVNTHLGLTGQERLLQVNSLISSPEWLASEKFSEPAVVVGDFNDIHHSPIYRRFTMDGGFRDSQLECGNKRWKNTFLSFLPLRCLDHVFVKGARVAGCQVPRTKLTTVASDHLPVIVDLEI